jgi:hypothetical protein
MEVFNRRNAVVGYLALKAAKRKLPRRKKRRNGAKIALFVGLGILTAGVLAGVLAVMYRRHGGDEEAILEGLEVGDDSDYEIVGEVVTAGPEPIEPA